MTEPLDQILKSIPYNVDGIPRDRVFKALKMMCANKEFCKMQRDKRNVAYCGGQLIKHCTLDALEICKIVLLKDDVNRWLGGCE